MGEVSKNDKRQRTGTHQPKSPAPGRSLAERFPAYAAEWDTAGNGTLRPGDVSYGSDVVASWVCPAGHGTYMLKVNHRTSRNRGCSKCGKARLDAPKKGKTLAEAFPEIAAEWDYEKNYPLTPADVAPRSNKKAYFICPVGHGSTESYISNRTAGNGCPDCGKKRNAAKTSSRAVARGNLADANPALAAEWNTEMNTLTPSDVSHGTPKVVWWNCPEGHDPYQAQVCRRHRGQGCPACANISRAKAISYKGPKPGTSLADTRPDLLPEWDTERNTLTPADVSAGSQKVVHWICRDGHRYERSVVQRAAVNICPVERKERSEARKAGGQPSAIVGLAA
ncbi:zinc-ribbon domain-containing protein [Pseudarthrobacter chlorophenolicus]